MNSYVGITMVKKNRDKIIIMPWWAEPQGIW